MICDDCSGEFDLKIAEAEIEPDIIEQYFQCPHCGARTTITITDPEMRAKIERRKRLRKEYAEAAKRASYQTLKRFLREDAKLKDELMQASREMKKKYHRGGEESDENKTS